MEKSEVMFDCAHRDQYGFCRFYSNLDADVPCPGNGDCDGYVEVEDWPRKVAEGNA